MEFEFNQVIIVRDKTLFFYFRYNIRVRAPPWQKDVLSFIEKLYLLNRSRQSSLSFKFSTIFRKYSLSLLYIDLPSKRSNWSTANYVFQSYEAIFFVNANLYHLSRPLIRNVRNEIQSDKYRYLEKQIPVSMLYIYIYGYIPRSPRISRGRFIRMFRL